MTLRQQNLGPEISKMEEEYKKRDEKEKSAGEFINSEIANQYERTRDLILIHEDLNLKVSSLTQQLQSLNILLVNKDDMRIFKTLF